MKNNTHALEEKKNSIIRNRLNKAKIPKKRLHTLS